MPPTNKQPATFMRQRERPSDNPLIVTVSSIEMVERYAQPLTDEVKQLMAKFWPGSLTIVLPLKPGSCQRR